MGSTRTLSLLGFPVSPHIDRDIGKILKSPTSRGVNLDNAIETSGNIWSECHQVKKIKSMYRYRSIHATKAQFITMFNSELSQTLTSFKTIDQEQEGPCSLAAITHLFKLYHRQNEIVDSKQCTKDFKQLYKNLGYDMDGYANWLAFFTSARRFSPQILDELLFIPLRVRRAYNTTLSNHEPKNADEYNRSINSFLKNLLDSGHAFAVPFEGHFVTVVGYSASGYLILNSFGNSTGFDGLWLIDPIVDPTYTQLNFCNGLSGLLCLKPQRIKKQ